MVRILYLLQSIILRIQFVDCYNRNAQFGRFLGVQPSKVIVY